MFLYLFFIVLTTFFGIVILNYLFQKIIKSLQLKYEKRNKKVLSSFLAALLYPAQTFFWFYGIISLIQFLIENLNWDILEWNLQFLTKIVLISSMTWFFYLWKKASIKNFKAEKKKNDPNLHYIDALDKLSSILLFFLSGMLILDQSGQNIGTLLTIGGIGAAAIGLAAKELITNCFGGFLIYVNSPFYVGDTIQISGKDIKGEVEEIGWYITKIRDEEKQSLYVPNALFFQFIIINFSRKTHKRFKETFYIEIKNDNQINKILSFFKDLVLNHPKIDLSEKYEIIFAFAEDNILKITLSFYSKEIKSLDFELIRQNFLIEIRRIIHEVGAILTNEQSPLKIQKVEY